MGVWIPHQGKAVQVSARVWPPPALALHPVYGVQGLLLHPLQRPKCGQTALRSGRRGHDASERRGLEGTDITPQGNTRTFTDDPGTAAAEAGGEWTEPSSGSAKLSAGPQPYGGWYCHFNRSNNAGTAFASSGSPGSTSGSTSGSTPNSVASPSQKTGPPSAFPVGVASSLLVPGRRTSLVPERQFMASRRDCRPGK